MSTGIRQYFTVVEREECDLPSSKYSRLNEGDHDDRDGSSTTAEEDMDGRESTNHVATTQQILGRTLSFPSQISSSSPDIYKP